MKNYFTLIAAAFLFSGRLQSQTVTVNEAANRIGEQLCVCAKVAGTHVTKGKSKVIYLNLEKPYPNSVFTVVIFEKSAENFDYNPIEFLKNKFVCVTGKVTSYQNKAQMVVNGQDQIRIIK